MGRQYVHRQGTIFGFGSGITIQIYGDWLKDSLLGPFHCPPQSAMGRLLHLAVYIAPPLLVQSDTLSLDSPPLNVRWIAA